jgi:ammonium transporter Rh
MLAHRKSFAFWAAFSQVVMLILFAVGLKYGDGATTSSTGEVDDNGAQTLVSEVDHYYPFYQDVHVMIFVGFGFLMTFLAKYGFSSVGMNFLIAALTIQWALLAVNYMHNVYDDYEHGGVVKLDITKLITADFAAGATLITFGAVLGKVTPVQMLAVVFLEILVYAGNEILGATYFQAVDMGGSIFVHTFGAYFGLALSRTISKAKVDDKGELVDHERNTSTRTSDMFAMVGTLFLWMYWPSFNGALALQSQQHRVVINTVISLTGSCIAAFITDVYMRPGNKFDMVSIQNATLAGGVAVGSSSDLVIQPWGALLVGLIAGTVSVIGYIHISPWMARKWGLDDTCGVHNLHGLPGIIGGIGGAISAATADSNAYGQDIGYVFAARAPKSLSQEEKIAGLEPGEGRSAQEQAYFQLAALACTLIFAILGGAITGMIVTHPCFLPPGPNKLKFGGNILNDEAGLEREYWHNDHHYWEVNGEDDDHKAAVHVENEMAKKEKSTEMVNKA